MSQLELNKGDNFIIAVDVSASMGATDTPTGQSRIDYAKEKTTYFAVEAGKWDEDGIDVFTFGGKVTSYPNVSSAKASEIIGALRANEGTTDTAAAIKAAYGRHKETGSKQTVLFIITDGEPADKNAVRQAIIDITNDLKDQHEFAISFLRIGKDPGIAAYLTELDDNLTGAKYDIVDVQAIEDVDFVEAFAKALHD